MTFPRYRALKEEWRENPPLHISAFAIASALGFKRAADANDNADSSTPGTTQSEVYYDESFYENTPQTPWNANAFEALKRDFQEAGGMVK